MDGNRAFLNQAGDIYLGDKKQNVNDSELHSVSDPLRKILENAPLPLKWDTVQDLYHRLATSFAGDSQAMIKELERQLEELQAHG